jgi:hypothetical protein
MKQIISAPDEKWITHIAKMWLLGNEISKDLLGEEMDGSLADLERLQLILQNNRIFDLNTQDLKSLGTLFGKVFVNQTTDYFKETTLIFFHKR